MGEGRMYRVPRRVSRRVEAALLESRPSGEALDVALVLTAGAPVDLSVPRRVDAFFSRDWRFDRRKVAVAGLYGGPVGLEWARKCLVSAGAVVAAAAGGPVVEYVEMAGYDRDSVGRLVEYRRVPSVPRWQDDESVVVADLEAWLDGVEAGPPGEVVVPVDEPGVEVVGFGEPLPGVMEDLDLEPGPGPVVSSGEGDGGDAGDPKGEAPAGGGEHHASKQLRDFHGRFAKVGSRVQGKSGRFGRIDRIEGDRAVVVTDAGQEVALDPKDVQVVAVEAARAVLEGSPDVVEDPGARLDAYLAWAAEQLTGPVAV